MSDITKVEAAPISNEAAQVTTAIVAMAQNPDVDIDKMERLMTLHKEMEASQAKREFASSMAAAQAEIEPVARDKRNDQTKSNYATLEAIAKAVKPITARHGFSLSFDTQPSSAPNMMRVSCDITHAGGHTKTFTAEIPIDAAGMAGKINKTPTHAFGSTMSYARRYLTMMAFDIATDDDDGNRAHAPETVSAEQFVAIRNVIEETGTDEARFLKFWGVARLEDIHADKSVDAINAIRDAAKKRAAQAGEA
jgi:hypothetical protein